MARKIATEAQWADLATRIKAKADASSIGNATITIQKNGDSAGTFTTNASSNKSINITVPTTAADVDALPDTTKYGASLAMSVNSETYVVTAILKDQDGNALGTAQTIDLPLESVVVSGAYNSTTKRVELTLQDGSVISFSVADLVSGLQTEITSTNKLSADLIDDSTSTKKLVTASQLTEIGTALQPGDNVSTLTNDAGYLTAVPVASTTTLGGVKAGTGVAIAADGTLSATGTSMVLYNTTGQNTDGAMTQKAVTDELANIPTEFTSSEWNALWA